MKVSSEPLVELIVRLEVAPVMLNTPPFPVRLPLANVQPLPAKLSVIFAFAVALKNTPGLLRKIVVPPGAAMKVVFVGGACIPERVASPWNVTVPFWGRTTGVFRLPPGAIVMFVCAKAGATAKKRRAKKARQEVKEGR